MAHQLTEEQKDALRTSYDIVIQHIEEEDYLGREYRKWVDTASGMLRAGHALGFDLYADYDRRHPDKEQSARS